MPGVVWLIAKAYVLFAGFVWVRASLHRVRTDQILEFGWRYLLPLSIVNLGVAIYLRLEVWTGESWPVWTAPALSLIALALFIIYAIDEDKDALAYSRRPYNIQSSDKAYPGRHKE